MLVTMPEAAQKSSDQIAGELVTHNWDVDGADIYVALQSSVAQDAECLRLPASLPSSSWTVVLLATVSCR